MSLLYIFFLKIENSISAIDMKFDTHDNTDIWPTYVRF